MASDYASWKKSKLGQSQDSSTNNKSYSDKVSYIKNRDTAAALEEQQRKAETEKLNKINGIINEIDSRTQKLFDAYNAEVNEREKFVNGEDGYYSKLQAPGLKTDSNVFKTEAEDIKTYIEKNKDYLSGEQYLAALQNVNTFIDTDFSETDDKFNSYFDSISQYGSKENLDKAVEEYQWQQQTSEKYGVNDDSNAIEIIGISEGIDTDDSNNADELKKEKSFLRNLAAQRITMDDYNVLSEGGAYDDIAAQFKAAAEINDYSKLMDSPDFDENSEVSDEQKKSLAFNPDLLSTTETAFKKFFGSVGSAPEDSDIPFVSMNATYDEITVGMTSDEKKIFNYLINTKGIEAAQEYRSLLNSETEFFAGIGSRKGEEFYKNNLEGHPILSALYSVPSGFFGQFSANLQGIGDMVTGAEPTPIEQTENMALYYAKQNSGNFENLVLDLGANIGNNLPGMVIAAATGGALSGAGVATNVANGIGRWAGASVIGTTAASQAYTQARNEGYSAGQAQGYAALTGASEAGLESLLGGIAGMTGGITGKSIEKAIEKIENVALKMLATYSLSSLGEFEEEYLQEILDPVFRNIMLDENNEFKPFTEEALYSGILGALSSVSMNIVPITAQTVHSVKTGAENTVRQTALGAQFSGTEAGVQLTKTAEQLGIDTSKASKEVKQRSGVGKLIEKIQTAVKNKNTGKLADKVIEAELKKAKSAALEVLGEGENNDLLAQGIAEISVGIAGEETLNMLTDLGLVNEENANLVAEAFSAVDKNTESGEVHAVIRSITDEENRGERRYTAKEIASVKHKDGKTVYVTKEGEEISPSRADISNAEKILFDDRTKGMTEEESAEMIEAYHKYGTNAHSFGMEWRLARSMGIAGITVNSERFNDYNPNFSSDEAVNRVLQTQALEQGAKAKARMKAENTIKEKAARVIKNRGRAKGEVRGTENIVENKGSALRVANFFAKLGYDVEFLGEDAVINGKRLGGTWKNGAYDSDTNTIYLRGNTKFKVKDEEGKFIRGILGQTLSHEITHSIQTWNEDQYDELVKYIQDVLGDKFNELVKNYEDKLGLEYHKAVDEVVCDGCEMLLKNSKALEKIATENANLFVKIGEAIRQFIARLRQALSGMYGKEEELHDAALRLRETLEKTVSGFEELQSIFDEALTNSIRNMRNALAEAENAETKANLDVLEKAAEDEGLKLSEENNESDSRDKLKFSEETGVEETRDLIAVHNTNVENLFTALKLGGIAAPSIAVVKSSMGHTGFGDVSIIFAKDTIDPKRSKNNKLYGSDAWTPTQTELKKNAKFDSNKTENTVNKIKSRLGKRAAAELFDISPRQFTDAIVKADGSIYQAFAHNIGMQAAYALEKGIIERIPNKENGTVDTAALKSELESTLDTDNGWRQYKKWLNGISDTVITSYDTATTADILRNMMSQPATAKPFKLTENGELVVPAVEYSSIDMLRENKHRLSSDAEAATKAVADKLLSFAQKTAKAADVSVKSSVEAINAAFEQRYDVHGIVSSFAESGVKISVESAAELQSLYREAVELPTPYFEAKPMGLVGIGQIRAVVLPDNAPTKLKAALKEVGINIVEHKAGSEKSRIEAMNSDSVRNLRFSEETSEEFAENEKKAIEDALENMSLADYNKRGWARSLLTREDSAKLNSAIAEAFNLRGKNSDIRLKDGTFAIEVNNKIVYVSGTFSNPRYDLVLVFDADNATEMEVLKDTFFSELKNKEILKNDILRWIKQRRSYGSIYGFNAENYKASSKQNFGRASCQSGIKGFGDFSKLVVRDGVYTKNEGDLSGSLSEIKLSEETDENTKAVRNERTLRKQVERLKALVKLQGNITHGSIFTDASVGKQATELRAKYNIKQNANSKVTKALHKFYAFISTAKELDWSDIQREAGKVAAVLLENERLNVGAEEFYSEAKKYLSSIGKIYINESQLAEGKYKHDKDVLREKLFGNVRFTTDASEKAIPLDSLYEEASDMFPSIFSPDVVAADRLNALVEGIDRINEALKPVSQTELMSEEEYDSYYADMIYDIYDSYYNANTYYTVADKWNKKLAEEKAKVGKEKQEKAALKEAIKDLRAEKREALKSERQRSREDMQKLRDTVNKRAEEQLKRRITGDIVKRLDAIDAKAKTDSKTKHIPSALRGVVAQFRMAVNTETQDYGKKIEAARDSIEKYSKRLEKLNAALEEASAEEAAEIKERIDAVNAAIEQKQRAIEKYEKYAVKSSDYTDALTKFYNAYYEKSLESDYEKAYYADTEAVIAAIEALKERIDGRSLYELNAEELQNVLDVTKMVQKSISNANKLFGETRSLADSVAKVADETEKYKALKKRRDKNLRPGEEKQKNKLGRWADKNIKYNMLKPSQLFLQSGSDTLYGLYKKLQRAEGDAAKLIEKYGNKYRETAKENGVTKKQFDAKHRIDLDSGMTVELTSGELMTLYATSRRKQGRQHLLGGGFRLSGGIIREVRNGKVEELKSFLCKLTEADLKKISDELEDNLKKFTETMQEYMSDEMAKDGNRVSMQLYDVAIFNDKFYIPLDVDDSTRPTSIEKGKENIKIINKGMTQSLNVNAANGVYILDFSDVFAKHAQDMSSYSAFTLPLENLERVLNSSADGVRIKAIIGEDLSREIFDFLKDVNGGIKSDSVLTSRLFSLSKAARVGLNLRVIIQQPTAIIRAMSEIDPKYFFGTSTKGMSDTMKRKLLEEMHDYTSTWIVKSMGGIDLNTSKAISDQITDLGVRGNKLRETIPNIINKGSFYLAEKADQIAWMSLYAACKREARAQGFTGEYLLKRAGERFDEIVNKTQVYDSVFSRAKILRSQNWLNKLASMFMAEPLTTANMMMDAARLSSHGNPAKAARITASVALSIVITNAFAAIIDALRDDDDDETYGEKYLEAIIRNLMNDFDPATYIPYARDVISLAQGYDIERADMSLIADFITKGTNLIKAYKNGGELADSWLKFAGSILNVTGIPFSSLYRDAKAIVNTVFRGQVRKIGDSTKTNVALGSLDALLDELPVAAVVYSPHSKSDKLYYAMVNGDDKYVKITKEEYADDEDKFNQLLKQGLKENDFRVAEAAQAHMDGDTEKYLELMSEVVKDGYDEKIVQGAILAAENKLNGEDENADRAIDGMLATKGDIISALEKGDSKYLNDYYEAKVKKYSSGEGKKDNPKKKALSATKAMLTDYYKPIYEEADSAERRRIRSILLKIKIDGKYLYDSSSFDNWDE